MATDNALQGARVLLSGGASIEEVLERWFRHLTFKATRGRFRVFLALSTGLERIPVDPPVSLLASIDGMPLALRTRSTRDEVAAGPDGTPHRVGAPLRRPRPPEAAVLTKRRPALIVGGVAIVIVCAAVGAMVGGRGSSEAAFLTSSRWLPAGAVLRTADLAVAKLGSDGGLAAVPASDSGVVLGRRTTVALPAGSLLVAADLGGRTAPAPDTALVGASLAGDQLPLGLEPGDAVLVVTTGGGSGTSSATDAGAGAGSGASFAGSTAKRSVATLVLARGTVFSVFAGGGSGAATAASSGDVSVTVTVPSTVAPEVAAASAAGTIALVEVPPPAPGRTSGGAAPSTSGGGR